MPSQRNRTSSSRLNQKTTRRRARQTDFSRQMNRRLMHETLEHRHLLTAGPELVTILPNAGSFLLDGDLRTETPQELTLRFSPGQAIDTDTLSGIAITRAGGDNSFEVGHVYSDLGTDGAVVVQFDALRLGDGGNGIEIRVSKSDLGPGELPIVEADLAAKTIDVTLNASTTTPTAAQAMVDAVNRDDVANLLVRASIRSGNETAPVGNSAIPVNYSPLTTAGANAAQGSTDFNVGGIPLEVLFTAVQPGPGGNGLTVAFRKADLGAAAGPTLAVSAPVTTPPSPATITVTLNSNPANPTTAQGLVNAINNHPAASTHVRASIPIGSPTTDISAPMVINPVVLDGANDMAVAPGYLALNEANPNEVIYRFARPLPNDLYRIEVYGTGPDTILRNSDGEAFNGGLDDRLTFTIDLGPQVTSVVPQPVLRDLVISVGSVGNLRDGDRILLTVGSREVVLELDDEAINDGVLPGNTEVSFSAGEAASTVASRIQTAIASQASYLDVESVSTAGSSVIVRGNAFHPTARLLTAVPGGLTLAEGGLIQRAEVVTVYFNNDTLEKTRAENPAFYRLVDVSDDTIRIPQSVTYDPVQHTAKLKFAADLPTATYRLQIGTSPEPNNTRGEAVRLGTLFDSTAFSTVAYLGDTPAGPADVDMYRFELAAAGHVTVTALPVASLDTTIRLLDRNGSPIADVNLVDQDAGLLDTLQTDAVQPPGTYYVEITGHSGTGSYHLDISTTAVLDLTDDDNSSYATATDVGVLGLAGKNIVAQIEPQPVLRPPMPGGDDEPGHRRIPVESHEIGIGTTPRLPGPIPLRYYNFADRYGRDPQGTPLFNQITEDQKQMTRAIFESLSHYTGVQWVEHASAGMQVVTGDIRAADPTLPVNAVGGISTGGMVIMNALFHADDNDWMGGWMGVALHEIGHEMGIGHSYDLPSVMGRGNSAETLWSGHDLVHLQRLYPPYSTDIDLYKFNVTEPGYFTADVMAERRTPAASTLDAALTLFRDPYARVTSGFGSGGAAQLQFTAANAGVFGNGIRVVVQKSDLGGPGNPLVSVSGHTVTLTLNTNAGNPSTAEQVVAAINGSTAATRLVTASQLSGSPTTDMTGIGSGTTLALSGGNREVIARNDGFYGADPFLEIDLEPGTYYVGVTARGNTNYDPTVSDTGFGGQSDGIYELRLDFETARGSALVDIDNPELAANALDGNADGRAGGAFNFWFQAGNTIFVDKASPTPIGQQDGSTAKPFSTIAAGLQKAGSRIVVPVDGPEGINDGDYFTISDGSNPTKFFEFDKDGGAGDVIGTNIRIDISTATSVGDVVEAIRDAIQSVTDDFQVSVAAYNVANGTVDLTNVVTMDLSESPGLLQTPNLVRIVGNGGPDRNLDTLNDARPYLIGVDNIGATLPDGRNFDVPQGVTAMIDGGAVLKLQGANIDVGTPILGANRQHGALQLLGTPYAQVHLTSFRNDALGGDSDGVSPGPAPGQWGGIVLREDSDLNRRSSPDSTRGVFLNSIYHADITYGGGQVDVNGILDAFDPIYIAGQRPTVAFSRITNSAGAAISADPNAFDDSGGRHGPHIHGNIVKDNSLNALFVRVTTAFEATIDKLSVNARFRATDITHVIAENLHIVGNAGGMVINNEIQELRALGNPTDGTFTISGGAQLPWNATVAEIESALEALQGVGMGGVRVTGGPLPQAPVVIEYINQAGSTNRQPLDIDYSELDGGAVVTRTLVEGGQRTARPGGRLLVEPGVVVKLSGARIEAERGSAQIIAEGTAERPVIFTSLKDDRYGGASGTFDTASDGFGTDPSNTPNRGDWGGLLFNLASRGKIDHAYIAFGGGQTPIEGGTGSFNAIGVHEASLRVANTTFENNQHGRELTNNRAGRENNDQAVIFVRGAQPVIVNNVFRNNAGALISIDANAMEARSVTDPGRATGPLDDFPQFANNLGPLVRLNRMANDTTIPGAILGMKVRSGPLDRATVWDDTDIVHVLASGKITDDKFHTSGGLRLQSAPDASLVVKLGAGAGFDIGTSSMTLLEIADRIGGSMQVAGTPGFPVVMTSLHDDSVGASLDPNGFPHTDTNGNGGATVPTPANYWAGILFDKYANDTNMVVVNEIERPLTGGVDINGTPGSAQHLGDLAPNLKSANENRRSGFQVHGYISLDAPNDVDVYSFTANAGTEVWLDIDKTDPALDAVLELVNSSGVVLARSVNNTTLISGSVTALPLMKAPQYGGDFYSQSINDPGMRVLLPGAAGTTNTYFVRVRSNPGESNLSDLKGGLTSGRYQLQIRLQQRDQQPGVAVRFADISYATNGIIVRGLPYHSPLTGEGREWPGNANTPALANPLGNLLASDRGNVSFGGRLDNAGDIDFYQFTLDYQQIQAIGGVNDGGNSWSTVIDLDWADGLTRPDTTIALFDSAGRLIHVGRASNIEDDRPSPGQGTHLHDLSRGSVGTRDPFIGPIQLPATNATYYLAVVNNQQLPTALNAQVLRGSAYTNVRLEPVTSVSRIVEDHIGYTGYTSHGAKIDPVSGPLLEIRTASQLQTHVTPFTLGDVQLYVGRPTNLWTVDPFTGERVTRVSQGAWNDVQDVHMRGDGYLYAYRRLPGNANNVGQLVRINTDTGAMEVIGNDGIAGYGTVPVGPVGSDILGGSSPSINRRHQTTTSDWVDALTIERLGTHSNLLEPVYIGYYAVREQDPYGAAEGYTSKLYRFNPDNGSAEPANLGTTGGINRGSTGVLGYIQPPGVSKSTTTITLVNQDGNAARIDIQSKDSGERSNEITINIQPVTGGGTSVVGVSLDTRTITVRVNRDGDGNITSTANAIINAINGNENSRRLVLAGLRAGDDGGIQGRNLGGGPTYVTGGGSGTPLNGHVTGLAMGSYNGGQLFGVTAAGEFLRISKFNGQVQYYRDLNAEFGITDLQGLTLGPQNVEGGMYANMLFATSGTGDLYALDSSGEPQMVFQSGDTVQEISLLGAPTEGMFQLNFQGQWTEPIAVTTQATVDVNMVQTVEFSGTATGGTYTLHFQGQDTQPIAWNAPLDTGVNALQRVQLTGSPTETFTLTFGDQTTDPIAFDAPASTDVDELQQIEVVDNPDSGSFILQFGTEETQRIGWNAPTTGDGINERQQLRLIGPPSSGTFTLTFEGQTTNPIERFANAADVRNALVGLSNIEPGDVVVSGGPLPDPVQIQFAGALGNSVRDLLEFDDTGLVAGEVEVTRVDDGGTPSVRGALVALDAIGVFDIFVDGGPLPTNNITVRFQQALGGQGVPELVVVDSTLENGSVQINTLEPGRTSVQTRLEALSNINAGDVAVTAGPSNSYDVEFTGGLARTDVPEISGEGTGDVNVSVTILDQGIASVRERLEGLPNLGIGDVLVTPAAGNSYNVEFTGSRAGSQVDVMTGDGDQLDPSQDITVTVEQAAVPSLRRVLQGLNDINIGDVAVAGGPLNQEPLRVVFTGQYAGQSIPAMGWQDYVNDPLPDGTAAQVLVLAGDGVAGAFVARVPGLPGITGLAFSPLDFNLWHPTTTRGNNAGHGINPAPDDTRTPSQALVDGNDGLGRITGGRTTKTNVRESAGHTSFYFGLDQYAPANVSDNASPYYRYTSLGQYGVREGNVHLDLSSNPNIAGTYNLPGGALGSLTTNSFSLYGYAPADQPTLYFNYFLETEDHGGSRTNTNTSNPFRDAARVFLSADGGATWDLVATNNPLLTTPTAGGELPMFLSEDYTYNGSQVQQLYPTAEWRQARIDVSAYAGQTDLRLRFDFTTAGTMNDPSQPQITPALNNNTFGEFRHDLRSIRSQDNQHEGFYINNIIVGFAERGEMVTAAPAGVSTFDNLYSGFAGGRANINNLPEPPSVIDSGAYQVEIRRGTEYAAPISETESDLAIYQTFDTNDRHVSGMPSNLPPMVANFDAPAEFDPFDMNLFVNAPGSVGNWAPSSERAVSPPRSFKSAPVTAVGGYSATRMENVQTSQGTISFFVMVDAALPDTSPGPSFTYNRFQFLINGSPQIINIGGTALNFLPGVGTATPQWVQLSFPISEGTHTLEWRYTKGNPNVFGADAAYIDTVVIPQAPIAWRTGDRNVPREQGMVVIEGNFIHNVSGTGIIVEAGARDAGNNFPYVGPVRQTPVLNNARLVTSTLVVNNVVSDFGTAGIRISGDTGTTPQAAVPMGKVINNTVYGGPSPSGIGIQITNAASPTVMNNIVANTAMGISVDASSWGLPS
ncbi:MAG: hypothetical protein EA424_17770, partial [Planctomycetaceae bacterium]